ncbi:hypothetical protein AQUCO_10100007v1 [Aquilegia coerulea]|uniref:Uncharacterized protein n=1 Tax=Aquilegia coerulea TaxID=218851 RepID=A0A2G5C5C8_AQUCA|nr:hypothetical protein AQUCO_10100003v1 [Aquilegia coerulea]PIA26007.1 hypothetical protein AQUCO_10100007v1 [Aquilegia coerulea]
MQTLFGRTYCHLGGIGRLEQCLDLVNQHHTQGRTCELIVNDRNPDDASADAKYGLVFARPTEIEGHLEGCDSLRLYSE